MIGPVVHIGYHKTATTWFQKTVFPAVSSHEFVGRKTTQAAFLQPPGMHFSPDRALEVLGVAGRNRPVVLSEENLSGYLHNGGLHGLVGPEMARRIHATLPDARVVIFIRNQFDILRASYTQYVAGGGTWSQSRYFGGMRHRHGALRNPWKAPAFEYEHFDFDRLIGFYEDLFGADRIHVYPYEWLRDEDSLLARMASDLDMEFQHRKGAARGRNAALGSISIGILRRANLLTRQSVVNKDCWFDLPGGQAYRFAVKLGLAGLPWINSRKPRLRTDVRDKASVFYAEGNRRLMERRELPLADLGYPV